MRNINPLALTMFYPVANAHMLTYKHCIGVLRNDVVMESRERLEEGELERGEKGDDVEE